MIPRRTPRFNSAGHDTAYDADIERLWNAGWSGRAIAEQLGVRIERVGATILLVLRVPHAEWKARRSDTVVGRCLFCDAPFTSKHSRRKFCNDRCGHQYRTHPPTLEERAERRRRVASFLRREQERAAQEHFLWMKRQRATRRGR